MSEPLSIAAIVVAVGGIVVNCIKSAHIQKCKSLCCWSDCSQPEPAPIKYKKKKNLVVMECPQTPPSPDTPEEEEAPATIGTPPKITNC